MTTDNVERLRQQLLEERQPLPRAVQFHIAGVTLELRSNNEDLLAKIAHYMAHLTAPSTAASPAGSANDQPVNITITAIEAPAPELDLAFKDWKREPGKQSRKDSYLALTPNTRLLRKVRTGMVFLQSPTEALAVGPCLKNDNQVINFINNQYMNYLQQQGWLICHAAGVVLDAHQNQAIALAGLSGGGKSTLMLTLMEGEQSRFVSNDRLFIKVEGDGALAAGVPKLPRVNPGTLLNNPRLRSLLPAARQQALTTLPKQTLWELEEKYDVPITACYGEGRIQHNAPLTALFILNWHHASDAETTITPVDLNQRRELLPAVMKSPGPFYQDSEGHFLDGDIRPTPEKYLAALKGVACYEITGRADFAKAADAITSLVGA